MPHFWQAGRLDLLRLLSPCLCLAAYALLGIGGCGTADKEGDVSVRPLLPAAHGEWRLADSSQVYDRRTIFDYIDGAGEIFLAYDFRAVSVFHFGRPGFPEIKVELFDMGTSDDAYGVFSHSREQELAGLGSGYEYRSGLLCFWQGVYFVCLSSSAPDARTESLLSSLAREISARMPPGGSRPMLLEGLPETGLLTETIRYFHTHTSLNAHYYLGSENLLGLSRQTNCVLANYAPDSAYVLCVEYPEPAVAEQHIGAKSHDIMEAALASIPPGLLEFRNAALVPADRYAVLVMRTASDTHALELASACLSRLQRSHTQETSP